MWTLPVALIAAVYGFSNEAAKTSDGYFTGFPNYWNGLVFYIYVLQTPSWLNGVMFLFFAFMVFVPIKYIYLSQTIHFRRLTVALTLIWMAMIAYSLVTFYLPDRTVVILSLFYPVYYFAMSFYLHFRGEKLPVAEIDSD